MKYQVKDYYVKEIADYYGISAQTVRLYDKKGLLPSGKNELNGYRIYTR
jgi:DNA-binding transcriptional MerR regulator